MDSKSFMRRFVALGASAAAILITVAACEDDHRYDHCDYIDRQCRTVCDYWCDSWGCYPSCWDQCWDNCYVDPRPPPSSSSSSSSSSGGSSGASDASTPVDGGSAPSGNGVLCSACSSNSDCEQGALCILRGGASSPPDAATSSEAGPPAGKGFCGHACQGAGDCPQGFTCTQIGPGKQCLPNTATCN